MRERRAILLGACRVDAGVTLAIPLHLHLPVLLVGLWLSIAFTAPVPETSINENRDARGSEDHIRMSRDAVVM